ncbi:MAG: TetR/AcrR family transcriptional regulator [Candidatus Treponema excrementipullorum]|uniref:TetR/AcrR family transcriptional regulator n=1 Tax=Candidatus Treponema excrementipullorum TaxID=2838768 RepID=A0A9E2L1L1_9SPIR|nr:TetR/AcrR family transcriptional regulator [Candidatus Treponema excrementipullorum]MDD7012640.1 TetR/AcrR family transcriptional regulator [Candidatus Treponema excrementipullorum]MDY4708171.1 TetR/AcrR family transcriptional regulator [Candidatus Treponema excrementipullorum]
MAIVVEHEKRKKEILDKALDLFMENGYEDVTFQKIADKCGVTRTTLYIYFKNKKEIFAWSIKQLTNEIESSLLKIIDNRDLSYEERLKSVLHTILQKCVDNYRLFVITLTYLLQLKNTGKDTKKIVQRRIIRLRHLLSTVIIDGITSGNFKKVNVHEANELIFNLIEAAVFRLTVFGPQDIQALQKSFDLTVSALLLEK